MHGDEPIYQTFDTPEEEELFIRENMEELLLNKNVNAEDICIASRTNRGVDDTKVLLNNAQRKFKDISATRKSSGAITVSTFHNLKGHEFKHIIVRGFSEDRIPFKHSGFDTYTPIQKREYLKQEKSLYYVVFSRAIQTLIITGVGAKSDWVK